MLPQYTELLLSCLMKGLKDSEGFIRASSMSAIGDICQMLKYSIGNIVVEVSNSYIFGKAAVSWRFGHCYFYAIYLVRNVIIKKKKMFTTINCSI